MTAVTATATTAAGELTSGSSAAVAHSAAPMRYSSAANAIAARASRWLLDSGAGSAPGSPPAVAAVSLISLSYRRPAELGHDRDSRPEANDRRQATLPSC